MSLQVHMPYHHKSALKRSSRFVDALIVHSPFRDHFRLCLRGPVRLPLGLTSYLLFSLVQSECIILGTPAQAPVYMHARGYFSVLTTYSASWSFSVNICDIDPFAQPLSGQDQCILANSRIEFSQDLVAHFDWGILVIQ